MVVIGSGYDFLFNAVLAHCDLQNLVFKVDFQFQNQFDISDNFNLKNGANFHIS